LPVQLKFITAEFIPEEKGLLLEIIQMPYILKFQYNLANHMQTLGK